MNSQESTDVNTTLAPKWLRIPAACTYSGMSRAKLYQLLTEGQIKSICVRKKGNIRGLRLISAESLDTFLESFIGK
jgi:Helix-turn-helix domain